jgi:hypothetical protein
MLLASPLYDGMCPAAVSGALGRPDGDHLSMHGQGAGFEDLELILRSRSDEVRCCPTRLIP